MSLFAPRPCRYGCGADEIAVPGPCTCTGRYARGACLLAHYKRVCPNKCDNDAALVWRLALTEAEST